MVSEAFSSGSGDDNSQDDKKLMEANKAPMTAAGPTQLAGSQQGRVASFSSGTPMAQGSGRFTNIQKYLDANQQATGNLGARANTQLNREFGKQEQDVQSKNTALQQAFQKGEQDIGVTGQGFQQQLGQINQGLKTGFTDFANREGFDSAGQQAMQLAQNQDYSRIASGQAVDERALTQQQQQALMAAQGVRGLVQKNLQGVETEQGRDQLFSQVLQPKQGYTAGQRSFDKLFLGGALGGIRSNLQGQQVKANELLGSTAGQEKVLTDLAAREAELTKNLVDTAAQSQDLFNETLGARQNIEFVNKLREDRFNKFRDDLAAGRISKQEADMLGLSGLDTYINQNQPGSTAPGASTTAQKNLIGTYNILNDPSTFNNYFSRGQDATTFQDIVTQPDFDAYKALEALALGRQTGALTGTSQLGSSIAASQGKQLDALAKDIATQDKVFMDQYAGKDFTGSGFRSATSFLERVGRVPSERTVFDETGTTGSAEIGKEYDLGQLQNQYRDQLSRLPTNGRTLLGTSAFAATNTTNLDDYIRSGQLANTNLAQVRNDLRADIERAASAEATARAQANVRNLLDQTINQTGVRNALTIDDTAPVVPQRFRNLV